MYDAGILHSGSLQLITTDEYWLNIKIVKYLLLYLEKDNFLGL